MNWISKKQICRVNPMSQRLAQAYKIYHPPLILPIKGGKVPSRLVGDGLCEGYFVLILLII